MKEEKGITLIALIIYISLMSFVVAGVTAITKSFYANINEFDKTSASATAVAKFNMYFVNDLKAAKVKVNKAEDKKIELSVRTKGETPKDETVTYSLNEDNGYLYRNKVKVCGNVKDLKIEADEKSSIVTVYLKINNYEKTTKYKLEPKEKDGDVHITD